MPQFTLRDLFAAVTIVAVLAAWWVDRFRLADDRDGWRAKYEFLEAYCYKLDDDLMKCMTALDQARRTK